MAVKAKTKAVAKTAPSARRAPASSFSTTICSPARRRKILPATSRPTSNSAVAIAHETVARHLPGTSVVDIRTEPGIESNGRPVSVITVVNDNMPFLFNSVLGEITESAGEPTLRHPSRGAGPPRQVGRLRDPSPKPPGSDANAERVSVIQVHVGRLSQDRAEGLKVRLGKVLGQVRAAVKDWKPMLARLDHAISDFRYAPVPLDKEAVTEAIAFLEWLRDDNFTFLGMREFHYSGGAASGTLDRSDKPGLGILSDPDVLVLRRGNEAVTTTPEIRAFLHGPDPLIVTKANAKSVVHRRIYLDYIGVKTYSPKGALTGELRIVGLFTSTAYTRSVMKIPYLRSKAEAVIAKSGFNPSDHSGKALINVLESYPRDELFQIAVPTLRKHAEAILALGERPRVRALVRVDQFDRFVSVLVFVPRDRYDSRVREKHRRLSEDRLRRPAFGLLPGLPGRQPGARAFHHRPLRRQDAEGRAGQSSRPASATSCGPGRMRSPRRRSTRQRRFAADRRSPRISRKAIAAASRRPRRLRDAGRIAGLDAANPIAIDYYRHAEPGAVAGGAEDLSFRRRRWRCRGACRCWRTWASASSASAPSRSATTTATRSSSTTWSSTTPSRRPIDLADGGALFEDVFLSVWRGACRQ